MKLFSIGEITSKMIELEREHNLLSWEIQGVKIYQVLRYLIYINSINSNIKQKEKYSVIRSKLFSKISNKLSRLKNFFLYNPFYDKNESDVLLFESSRKHKINGKYIDTFTAQVKSELLDSNSNFTIYQSSYFFDRFAEKSKNTKHLDFIFFSAAYKAKFYKINLTREEIEIINKYSDLFKNNLNLSLNFFQLVKSQLVNFFILSEYYSKLLEIKKPKQIYLVNFCDKSALINECKKRNIKVTDIQHGFISSKDIIYHYPDSGENELAYFPDKFLAWSELWMGECKLPLTKENLEFTENYTLKNEIEKYKGVTKNSTKVLVLSQDTLTEQIFDEIYELVKCNQNYSFFYKPHPNEYAYISEVKKYSELCKLDNFFTIGIKDSLYHHLSDTKFVIGVYTTSLIEALYFNCEVFVLNLPGSEMMDYLLQSGKVKSISELTLK